MNTQLLEVPLPVLHGAGEVLYEIDAVPLLDGTYPLVVEFSTRDGGTVYDRSEQQHWFEVMNPDRRVGTVAFDVSVKVTASLASGEGRVDRRSRRRSGRRRRSGQRRRSGWRRRHAAP